MATTAPRGCSLSYATAAGSSVRTGSPRLMREHDIVGRSGRRRRHHTTRQATVQPDIPDLVRRDFTADAPDRLWCTDLTYVPTAEGWLYRDHRRVLPQVVGWATDDHMRTDLMLDA